MSEDRTAARPAREEAPALEEPPAAQPPAAEGDEPSLQRGESTDLLTIGLLVFFVAVLLIVAGLLALPLILG